MYQGKRVVVFSPAGRRRTMDLLIPYVCAEPIVDEYMIWLNTSDADDEDWLRQVAASDPDFFRIVEVTEQPEKKDASRLQYFWKFVTDDNTIYIRLDDDIVFIAPGTIKKLVQERVNNPNPLLITPVVINNACSTHLLQQAGIIKEKDPKHAICKPVRLTCMDDIGWRNPVFASYLHEMVMPFLKHRQLDKLTIADFTFPPRHRFSINCVCFFGEDIETGDIGVQEEADLCKLGRNDRPTLLLGDCLVAHYAFGLHYRTLNREPILNWYADLPRIYEIPAVDLGRAERGFVPPMTFPEGLIPQEKRFG
jgi:hypothetical protein